jgi:hypothetical protein
MSFSMNSRLSALFIVGCLPLFTGCFTADAMKGRWMDRFQLFRSTPDDTAFVEYVLIERRAGDETINRRVWDRVDETVLPFESRSILEENGLRIGTISGSTPGPMRSLIEDPRTDKGHRFRSFQADKPISLAVSEMIPKTDFTFTAGNHPPVKFQHETVQLGFQLSISEGKNGNLVVKCTPEGKYRDLKPFNTDLSTDREFTTEQFVDGTFEISLNSTEYLVIGTDSYREHTLGYAAFINQGNNQPMQRMLVIRAGRNKSERQAPPLMNGEADDAGPLPLASQASVIRGAAPK